MTRQAHIGYTPEADRFGHALRLVPLRGPAARGAGDAVRADFVEGGVRRLIAGAWIMTAKGWVRLNLAPQVVFEQDIYGQTGPIDFESWFREAHDYDGEPE